MIEPHRSALGGAYDAYLNHVQRTLACCRLLSPGEVAAETELAWTVAGAFHDLGIWTDNTWDYLEPSVALAEDWLDENDRRDLAPIVGRMIREHHGLRRRGQKDDPVEIFRRADVIDVWLGLRRYGVKLGDYRQLLREFPDSGFHTTLIKLFAANFVRRPWKPAPMFKL